MFGASDQHEKKKGKGNPRTGHAPRAAQLIWYMGGLLTMNNETANHRIQLSWSVA